MARPVGPKSLRIMNRMGEKIEALEARITELEAALKPFAEFATWTDETGWTSTIHKEPISIWFGPSDFREASRVLSPRED